MELKTSLAKACSYIFCPGRWDA